METVVTRADRFVDLFLRNLRLQDPSGRDGLWIFPLELEGAPVACPPLLTLEEGLRGHAVEIREVTVQGQVNRLAAESRAERPILLLDGEELVGARQNRILNTSLLVGAQRQVQLPVSCVEQGRWAYGERADFATEGRLCPVSLRSRKLRQVTRSLRSGQGFVADQGEVWRDVQQLNTRLGASSATQAMADGLRRHTRTLQSQFRARPTAGQAGCLAVLGQQVLALDAFASPDLYARVHRRLLDSYAIEGQGRRPRNLAPDRARALAQRFLENLYVRQTEIHRSLGEGLEARFAAPQAAGTALLYGGAVVHLAAFPDWNWIKT